MSMAAPGLYGGEEGEEGGEDARDSGQRRAGPFAQTAGKRGGVTTFRQFFGEIAHLRNWGAECACAQKHHQI